MIRRSTALALCAALAGTLAACGSSEDDNTLTWYINPDGGGADPTGGGQAQIAAECSAESGGKYKIKVELLPNDASDQRDQLLRRLAAGDRTMDIMSVDPVFVPEFAEAGFLAPVPQDLEKDFTEDRVDGAIVASTWQDKLVAVPFWSNTQLLWYRKSVAKEAGLDPSKGVTWQEVIDAAKSQSKTIAVQGSRYEGYAVWINALVEGAGGQILENPGAPADELKFGLDSEAGKTAASVIQQIATTGVGGPALSSSDEPASLTLFSGKQSGFMVNWPYVWAAIRDAGTPKLDDVGFAKYPATMDGEKSAPPLGGIQLAVGAKSKNPELAYEALQCITNEKNQKLNMMGTGNPASRKAVYDDPEVKKEFPMGALIRESLDEAAPRPQSQFYGDISAALQKEFSPPNKVNTETPKKAQELIQAVLKGEALL